MTTDTDTQTAPKTRTITLTDRPPVRIREDQWPQIALGEDETHDGEIRAQANRVTEAFIRVRQHADGRAIVYGRYQHETHWQGERNLDERAGELIAAGEDLAAAIHHVADSLVEAGGDAAMLGRVVRECIADLPAEVL